MAPKLRLILLLVVASAGMALGQSTEDLSWARRAMLPADVHSTPKTPENARRSIGQSVARAGFRVYKACISSQDLRRCNFTVSCSEYCLGAIHRHGFWAGMAIGLDRYSRCHGLHRSFYRWDPRRLRSIDLLPQ
jgi:putative component of membrane protein insertase Oxa1/YidC/SpoIIIJ protein YidD